MAIGQLHHIPRQVLKGPILASPRSSCEDSPVWSCNPIGTKLHRYYITLIKLLNRSYHKAASRRCIVCNIAKIIIVRS